MIKYVLIPNPFERNELLMRQKIYTTLVVTAVVVLISGASILATASPATQSDPLITRSYLTNIFRPLITADINAARTALDQKFTSQINNVTNLVNNIATPPEASLFVSKTLNANQILSYKAGSEIMLRSGTAQAGTLGLVNYTGGTDTLVDGSLILNNMYLASQDGFIKATASSTILIRGAPSTIGIAPATITIDDVLTGPEDPEITDDPVDPDNTEPGLIDD